MGNVVCRFIVSLIYFVLAGCASNGGLELSGADFTCSDPDNSHEYYRTGDRLIVEGRLFAFEERLEFRPCDKAEMYLLITTFEIEDVLRQQALMLHAVDSAPIYVRFNGYELECGHTLPDAYAGVVRATDLQVSYAAVPPNCG